MANAKTAKPNRNSKKNGKRKNTNSPADQNSKKQKKFCQLCNDGKFGGNHITHNTPEFCRYNKDGTLKNPKDKKPSKNTNKKSKFSSLPNSASPLPRFKRVLKRTGKLLAKRSITTVIVSPIPNRKFGTVAPEN